jgi:hypothetical protein
MKYFLCRSNNIVQAFMLVIVLLIFPSFSQVTYGGDIIGKIITGYQGWFVCSGDTSPLDGWVHWAQGSTAPRPGYAGFDLYPDMREYTTTYNTGFANFGNGQAATLFSSYDAQVVNKHFEWMETYGIDVAALQRFGHSLSSSKHKGHKDGIATRVKNAAEAYNRKFYIMYDISSWDGFQSEIKTDWINTITGSLDLLSSPAYAKENGMPVVCVWGIGSSGRPGNQNSWTDVITWLKDQGCYVIVGAEKNWRERPDVRMACENADMISPWHVGTFSLTGVDTWGDKIAADMIHCKNLGIDYMPVLWPGFSWANWKEGYENKQNHHPRMHGDFMWHQFYVVKRKFNWAEMTATAYIAMFDEYDESTAIAKAAEDESMIPGDQWFLTLDADGVRCSSDFYLRLTGDGAKMLKDQIGLTATHPTPHTIIIIPPGTYPAEDADFVGPVFSQFYSNYHGSGYLEFSNSSDDYIEWKVNTPSTAEYNLFFRYALKDPSGRPLKLEINGVEVEDSLVFTSTQSWSNWEIVKTVQFLNAGENLIRLTAIGSSGGNIDELVVKENSLIADGIYYDDFEENSFGNWNDGGVHCKIDSSDYAHQGYYSINLQSKSYGAYTTTNNMDLSYYSNINIKFWYKCISMEPGEEFWLQISTDGGSNFTTVKKWISGTDFENDNFYLDSVLITGYHLTEKTQLRFRCNASYSDDDVYLDEIEVAAGNIILGSQSINNAPVIFYSFPNPFYDETTISYVLTEKFNVSVRIYNLKGELINTLLTNKKQNIGKHSITWNPTKYTGRNIQNGTYIYLINGVNKNGEFVKSKQLVFLSK